MKRRNIIVIWGLFTIYLWILLGNLLIFRFFHMMRNDSNLYFYSDDRFVQGFINSHALLQNINIIPFKTIGLFIIHYNSNYFHFSTFFYNILLNIAAFIPLGIFLPILFMKMKKFGRFLLAITSLILTVELTQLLLHLGQFDIDDVILNVLGGMLGFGLLGLVNKWRKRIQFISFH